MKTIETRFAGIEKFQASKNTRNAKEISRRDAEARRVFGHRIYRMDRILGDAASSRVPVGEGEESKK